MEPFARRQLYGMEIASLDCATHAFPPHFHDEFVLSVNTGGRERITLDRKTMEAGEREITLYNPAQVQSSHAVGNKWLFFSLYVAPSFLLETFDLSPETVFDQAVLKHNDAARRMAGAISYGLANEVPEDECAERLIQTLQELLNVAGSRRAVVSKHAPTMLRHVADRLAEPAPLPTLAELSTETGLTPVQLVRAFTRAYGLPPFAWASNRRLNEARRRVTQGDAIAHVAADLGFADQAHLTRRFRAMYGVPPGRWRRGGNHIQDVGNAIEHG